MFIYCRIHVKHECDRIWDQLNSYVPKSTADIQNVYIYTFMRFLSFPQVGRKETRKYTQRFSHFWAYYQTRENVALYLKSCIMKIHPKVHMQYFKSKL